MDSNSNGHTGELENAKGSKLETELKTRGDVRRRGGEKRKIMRERSCGFLPVLKRLQAGFVEVTISQDLRPPCRGGQNPPDPGFFRSDPSITLNILSAAASS
jgi:hypothetical protein